MFEPHLWQAIFLELSLAAIAFLAARHAPWQNFAGRVELLLARLASRPRLSFGALVLCSIALRIALLPLQPVPIPLYHDEFSYLLGAETLAHGRLTNPAPPVPIAFETIHINVSPTYQSMYLPGTALLLAAGRLLGSPWIAVLFITALLAGTVYWMMAGWISRGYALLAGMITIALTGNMNWWFDNYFCIALTSLGTAVVLGCLPRIARSKRPAFAFLLGAGLSCLMLTRPYEGFCVTFPCIVVLLWTLRRTELSGLAKLIASACALPAVATIWLLYYNWKGTGKALLFPYMLDFARYHITGPFLFSAKRPLPSYDLDILRRFYIFAEVSQYDFIHLHPWIFFAKKIVVYYMAVLFGFGMPFVAGVVYLIRKRHPPLWLAPAAGLCGVAVNVILMGWTPFPQYIAPAFPLLLLLLGLGFLCIREMNFGRITGAQLTRGLALAQIMFTLSLFGYRVSDARNAPEPQYVSKDREAVRKMMLQHPGKHLALVRYTPFHESWQEWVFNGADLQGEKIVWARSLNPRTDQAVLAAFPNRTVWLVRPDLADRLVTRYGGYAASADAPRFPMAPQRDAVKRTCSSVDDRSGGFMTLYKCAFTVMLASRVAVGQLAPHGLEPLQTLGARDVATEFKLPPMKDGQGTQLSKEEAHLQVLVRAKALGLDGHSATQAWTAAEAIFRDAVRSDQVDVSSPAPVVFSGKFASALNKVLAQRGTSAVRVTSPELSVDEPLLLTRSDVSLDLGSAVLRQAGTMPFMIRVEGVHDVRLRGGSVVAGRWGLVIASSQRVNVQGIHMKDLSGGGLAVTDSQEVVVSRSSFHGLRGAGILIHGETHGMVVMGNEIEENLAPSNWSAGVVLTDREANIAANPDDLFVEGGYWVREKPIMERLHAPRNNVIAYNTITGNASSGIYSDGSLKNVFVGNRIERNSKEGICLDNGSTSNVVAFNLMRGNGSRWGKSDEELKLDFVAQMGRLDDGTSPAKLPGVSIDNAVYNQVVFNEVDGNFGGGVKLVRTSFYNVIGLNTLTDNNVGESSSFHFFGIEAGAAKGDAASKELDFTPSRGNQIFGNLIRGDHYAGIFLAAGSDQNDVFDNSIFGATSWAMESEVEQSNTSLNNLTNQKLRNIGSGLDPALMVVGAGVNDAAPVAPLTPPHE